MDRRLVGFGPGERDIGSQGLVEQVGVLRDQRDARPQMVELELAQIDPVDQDSAGARVPEPQQQIGDCRLAGA